MSRRTPRRAEAPPVSPTPLATVDEHSVRPTDSVLPVEESDLPDDDWVDSAEGAPAAASGRAVPGGEPEVRLLMVDPVSHGLRLDVFLVSGASEYSRSHLKGLIESGCVQVDGHPVDSASRKVAQGQQIRVVLRPTAQSLAFVAEPMDLPIVFEDEHLLVVNKPAGWVVHPAAGNWTGTLMNGVLAHHAGAVDLPRAGIVHRLDKDTSGLMVVGKTLAAVTALSRAIAAREVGRQYLALVHGVVPDLFTVDAAMGRDPATRVKMALVPVGMGGKPARTDIERLLVGQWPLLDDRDGPVPRSFSGVLCTLHSGRTHQIRVHLASRRHPLVGDALYGGVALLQMARQALHAARLSFLHPITGQPLRFEAPLPQDMAHAWSLLQAAADSAPTDA